MKTISEQSQSSHSGKALKVVVIIVLALLLLGGVFYGTYQWQHSSVTNLEQKVSQLNGQLDDAKKGGSGDQAQNDITYTSEKGVKIKVYTPSTNANVKSPLIILGEVPGNWSFEASFPVILKNSTGTVVAQASAALLGDWMTTELVPFSLKLEYASTETGEGTLVLQKDNASGLAANDDSVTIPIKF